MLLILVSIIILLLVAGCIVTNQSSFGKKSTGKRLDRIKASPHYKDGAFHNLEETSQFAEDISVTGIFWKMLTQRRKDKKPKQAIKSEKTDLHQLSVDENVLIWMGHSTYFIQLDGKRFLIDPVFSGYAGPFSFMNHSFEGSDIYKVEDIPKIDYLIITHDHWDHLDYNTVKKLFPKVEKSITGLGTGAHLEYWGQDSQKIIELDWFEKADLGNGFRISGEPARHFSGRGLRRNGTLWMSFVLESPTQRIYIGGDSGYGKHYSEIGNRYDSIDLAILETGQYSNNWPYIHLLPGEHQQVIKELKAKRFLPVHNSKFSLSQHAWNDPLVETLKQNSSDIKILTPQIGEKLIWVNDEKEYQKWWEELE